MLGEILGTADLTGQMADRTYLEKLLLLFLEFEDVAARCCFAALNTVQSPSLSRLRKMSDRLTVSSVFDHETHTLMGRKNLCVLTLLSD